jgi:hypothetical protein
MWTYFLVFMDENNHERFSQGKKEETKTEEIRKLKTWKMVWSQTMELCSAVSLFEQRYIPNKEETYINV